MNKRRRWKAKRRRSERYWEQATEREWVRIMSLMDPSPPDPEVMALLFADRRELYL